MVMQFGAGFLFGILVMATVALILYFTAGGDDDF